MLLIAFLSVRVCMCVCACSVYCRAIALIDLMFFRWRNRLWIKFILHYFGPSWRSHWWIPQQMASNTQLWRFVADCLKSCRTNGTFANYSKPSHGVTTMIFIDHCSLRFLGFIGLSSHPCIHLCYHKVRQVPLSKFPGSEEHPWSCKGWGKCVGGRYKQD